MVRASRPLRRFGRARTSDSAGCSPAGRRTRGWSVECSRALDTCSAEYSPAHSDSWALGTCSAECSPVHFDSSALETCWAEYSQDRCWRLATVVRRVVRRLCGDAGRRVALRRLRPVMCRKRCLVGDLRRRGDPVLGGGELRATRPTEPGIRHVLGAARRATHPDSSVTQGRRLHPSATPIWSPDPDYPVC